MVHARLTYRNLLLQYMARSDYAALVLLLKPVRLLAGERVEQPGESIRQVIFPESGVLSVMAVGASEARLKSGLIGREGMTGIPLVLGAEFATHETRVEIAGAGHAVAAEDLRVILRARPTILAVLLRNVQAFAVQTAHAALDHASGSIDQRVARWLLMAQDRMETVELQVTHGLVAIALGVRRANVTNAIQRLEGGHIVHARRGAIVIRSRERLEHVARDSYGLPEREHQRLVGAWPQGGGYVRCSQSTAATRSRLALAN